MGTNLSPNPRGVSESLAGSEPLGSGRQDAYILALCYWPHHICMVSQTETTLTWSTIQVSESSKKILD